MKSLDGMIIKVNLILLRRLDCLPMSELFEGMEPLQEKAAAQQVAALKKELQDAKSLHETTRSSAQAVRMQLELSKVTAALLPL